MIACGLLLRPIIIKPESEPEPSDTDQEQVSLKQLEAVYELENEQTITSLSSGASRGSEDSGITSLYASDVDLRAAEEQAVPDGGAQEPSTLSTPVEEGEVAGLEAGPLQPSRPKLLDFSVLKDGAFIWYSLFGLFATLGFFAPQLYVIELSKSRGVEQNMASYMLSVMAVAEIFGRLSIGVVLNKVSCRKTLVLLGCVVLLCLVLVAFTIVWEFWGLVLCCTLYGYFLGTVASTHIPMLAEEDVVGIQKMPSCVGVYVFIQSFAGLAGPPLGGKAPFRCLATGGRGGQSDLQGQQVWPVGFCGVVLPPNSSLIFPSRCVGGCHSQLRSSLLLLRSRNGRQRHLPGSGRPGQVRHVPKAARQKPGRRDDVSGP